MQVYCSSIFCFLSGRSYRAILCRSAVICGSSCDEFGVRWFVNRQTSIKYLLRLTLWAVQAQVALINSRYPMSSQQLQFLSKVVINLPLCMYAWSSSEIRQLNRIIEYEYIDSFIRQVYHHTMGVIEILNRIVKLGILNLSKLSYAGKLLVISGLAFFLKLYLRSSKAPPPISTIAISDFFSPLNMSLLSHVTVYPHILLAKDKLNNILKVNRVGMPQQTLYNELMKANVSFSYAATVKGFNTELLIFLLSCFVSIILTYVFYGGKDEKKASKPMSGVRFSDIIGLENAKVSLKEVIQFMFNSDKFREKGARMRKGVLLYGPPGTGKTTLAKACANEAGVQFYSCNGAQFCEIYIGMGPKKVRQLFAKAKKTAPSIIFIDQLDAMGSRGKEYSIFQNSNSEKNSTINQLLSELDGFESNDQILVIGATNRLQMVDKSLIRSGRFDVKIHTPAPTLEDRILIFQNYLRKTKSNVQEEFIRKILEGWESPTGADIETLVNEGIYHAMRRDSETVENQDLLAVMKDMGLFVPRIK